LPKSIRNSNPPETKNLAYHPPEDPRGKENQDVTRREKAVGCNKRR